MRFRCTFVFGLFFLLMTGCFPVPNNPIDVPVPGPDKQAAGTWYGAIMGAGSGAVTGAQLSAGAGPGAWVGAGLGAAWGMFSGLGVDLLEEDRLRREGEIARARELIWVQEVLAEQYARRIELHPNRDLYPADLFFDGDSTKLRDESVVLVEEMARMTKQSRPWSRVVIASYVTVEDPSSAYATHLTQRRAEEIALVFVREGIEPRRVLTQAVSLAEPILIDPYDSKSRYRQAIELISLD